MGSTGGEGEKKKEEEKTEKENLEEEREEEENLEQSNIEWLNIQNATFLRIVPLFAREWLNTKCLAKLVLEEQ